MRIRKHAKISPLHYASSIFFQQHGAVLQTHVCQLNQSPWDVITFPGEDLQNDNIINHHTLLPPPPPAPAPSSSSYQLDGYDSCAVNGTFYDSEQSITTMKLEANDSEMNYFEDNIVADVPADSGDFEKDEQDNEMIDGNNNNNITTMCCKNDGKGWQCSRESKRGHNLCDHHFAQKHYITINNSAHSTTAAETTHSSRGRPHRPKKSSSSEFYYYSGFGPLWGKKRGPSSTDKSTNGAQSSSSQMDNEGFDYMEDDEYDDNDDDEVEICKLKIKRARKPIKARSLKSLM
ncbi:uncharacterized protein LOC129873846 isoform X2 [Solanum dulcamara]|uniref:uncharacterized protein LOC129873846 isoform X2 n=1 Tax=Solanum dulcamara TaxID=45834 RepID=UPI0024861435|nr:uncharacterized protein LOC129873846 isoform X2 [Solanum dulcamara]